MMSDDSMALDHIVPTLKAMASNYANGHSWDKLDGRAVLAAAARITELEARPAIATVDLRERVAEMRKFLTRIDLQVAESEHAYSLPKGVFGPVLSSVTELRVVAHDFDAAILALTTHSAEVGL